MAEGQGSKQLLCFPSDSLFTKISAECDGGISGGENKRITAQRYQWDGASLFSQIRC